jgi:hypothetical protein
MSTRSITIVRSKWEGHPMRIHSVIYRHHDGYISGHGVDLADFMRNVIVTNGARGKTDDINYINGPGRLAAELVCFLQDEGHEPDILGGEHVDCGQEYEYYIDVAFGMDGGTITMSVTRGPMTFFGGGGDKCDQPLFTGTVDEYCEFVKRGDD